MHRKFRFNQRVQLHADVTFDFATQETVDRLDLRFARSTQSPSCYRSKSQRQFGVIGNKCIYFHSRTFYSCLYLVDLDCRLGIPESVGGQAEILFQITL